MRRLLFETLSIKKIYVTTIISVSHHHVLVQVILCLILAEVVLLGDAEVRERSIG